jgi:hypothetical protein
MEDIISPQVLCMSLVSDVVKLALHCDKAEDDSTGIYREAALEDLERIREITAKITIKVSALTVRKAVA